MNNCTTLAVVTACNSDNFHIGTILLQRDPRPRSLRWLRITERIEYRLLSLTYKALTITQPPYLHNLISAQRPRSTRSSSVVTCSATFIILSKITDHSIRYASTCLWNQLPLSLRQPHCGTSSSISGWTHLLLHPSFFSFSVSPLRTSITPSLFHSRLKTHFHKSYHP